MTGVSIIGIDSSLTSTGLTLIGNGVVLQTVRVRPKAIKDRTPDQSHARLTQILAAISKMVHEAPIGPLKVGIEGPSFGSKGASVHQVAGLWWLITHHVYTLGLDYYVVSPSGRMKYATGSGRASKDEVLAAVIRRYQNLVEVTGNDVADSLVVAAMGARHYALPLEISLPVVNLKAMEAVRWGDHV